MISNEGSLSVWVLINIPDYALNFPQMRGDWKRWGLLDFPFDSTEPSFEAQFISRHLASVRARVTFQKLSFSETVQPNMYEFLRPLCPIKLKLLMLRFFTSNKIICWPPLLFLHHRLDIGLALKIMLWWNSMPKRWFHWMFHCQN